MEAGLQPSELNGRDGKGILAARLLQGDEETGSRHASDPDMIEAEVIKQVSTGESAAMTSKPTRSIDASERTALAVAATAAVELTNLFFLLSGDDDEPRCCCWSSSSCWAEGLAVALAFAAFVSAAALAFSGDRRRRVLLLVSAVALFVASGAMGLSLLTSSRKWILTGSVLG